MIIYPQHIPNGKTFSENDLKAVNQKLAVQHKKEVICWIGTLIGMFVLGGIMSVIGGAVGYILAAVCFVAAIPLSAFMARKPGKDTFTEASRLGIDGETWRTVISNCYEDKCAWGDRASKKIRYRFKCKKCKKESSWIEYNLSSCTEESLDKKLTEFQQLTGDKGYFYEKKKIGGIHYSLDRKCPFCGKIQPKKSPRWWTVPLTAAGTFLLLIIYTLIMILIREALGLELRHNVIDKVFLGDPFGFVSMILILLSVVVPIVRCVCLRKKNAPEYDLS